MAGGTWPPTMGVIAAAPDNHGGAQLPVVGEVLAAQACRRGWPNSKVNRILSVTAPDWFITCSGTLRQSCNGATLRNVLAREKVTIGF